MTRVGRSGPNVRVSASVVPQSRREAEAAPLARRGVTVTGGEHRGLKGETTFHFPPRLKWGKGVLPFLFI